jgi:hypothetical protein
VNVSAGETRIGNASGDPGSSALVTQGLHAGELILGDALSMSKTLNLIPQVLKGSTDSDGLADLVQSNVVLGTIGRAVAGESHSWLGA